MTKREAKAIIDCSLKIRLALNKCLDKLSEREKEYAEAYWAAHIRSTAQGMVYGSMPLNRASTVLNGED